MQAHDGRTHDNPHQKKFFSTLLAKEGVHLLQLYVAQILLVHTSIARNANRTIGFHKSIGLAGICNCIIIIIVLTKYMRDCLA